MKHVNVALFVPHAGCPHTCIFCDQRAISGRAAPLTAADIAAACRTAAACPHDPENSEIAFFGGIKNARFKKQVKPGDVLNLRCEITSMRGPIGFGKCVARVDGKVAAMAEISFVIGEDKE